MTTRTARGSYTHNTAPAGGACDWRTRGACRGTDPETFFSVATTGPRYAADVAAAKTVCRSCPVVTDCLRWALATRLEFGVAGGMAEDERRALTRPRHQPSPAQTAELRKRRAERLAGIADIREMADAGLVDAEIAARLNRADPAAKWTTGSVHAARRRHDIESGYRIRQRTQGAA